MFSFLNNDTLKMFYTNKYVINYYTHKKYIYTYSLVNYERDHFKV